MTLACLQQAGNSPDEWLRNWLAGRRQRLCQSYSNWAPVTCGVPHGSVLGPLLFLIHINGLDTNIISKMSKFADDTKLCHRAKNSDVIMELQEDINKLVEWVNMWQMNFNVDNCSVMHIGDTTCKATITCPINRCRQQINSGSSNHHHQRPQVAKTKREKLQNGQQSTGVHCPQFQVQKQRTDHPIIQISSPPTSRTCSAILVPTFKARH